MDALLILAAKNKEFGTLVVIMFFTIAQFFQNRGQFSLHLEKIDRVDEKATDAKKDSKEAIDSIKEIKPKVDDMHDWFKSLSDDKFKGIQGIVNGKEESTEA